MTIRSVIVDDEAYARQKIREFLREEPGFVVAGEAGSGSAAVRIIKKERPDLVFLDIQMPEPDGFGVVEALGPDALPHIIFATAYQQYTLQAFEIHALDYLLKPFDKDRFREALRHAAKVIGLAQAQDDFRLRVREMMNDIRTPGPYLKRFLIPSPKKVAFIKAADVLWIEAAGSYAALHSEREEHLVREPLSGLEGKLDPQVFIRVHRSFIVNLAKISVIDRNRIVFDGKVYIPVSEQYKDKFQEYIKGNFV